jgi:hypothetical protein
VEDYDLYGNKLREVVPFTLYFYEETQNAYNIMDHNTIVANIGVDYS